MNEETIDYLYNELAEVNANIDCVLGQIEEINETFPIDITTKLKDGSYTAAYNLITKMSESLNRYDNLVLDNEDFFKGRRTIFMEYIVVYLVSIIAVKVFAKIISYDKFNEMFQGLFGLLLGTTNMSLVNKHLNEYHYGTKENRELVGELKDLKKEYNECHVAVRRSIDFLQALYRTLCTELDNLEKKLIKKVD